MGAEPWSSQPRQVARVVEACSLPGAWVAEQRDGPIRAALVLGEAMPYVPAATAPEIYVRLLVASRHSSARGIGRRLMAFAEDQARLAEVKRMRVDCYGGGSGALVRFMNPAATSESPPWTLTAGPASFWDATCDDARSAWRPDQASVTA